VVFTENNKVAARRRASKSVTRFESDEQMSGMNSRGAEIEAKTLLVHYWLVNMRGGEFVLEALGRIFPKADLLANVIDESLLAGSLLGKEIRATYINRLPLAKKLYPLYTGLMPGALEQFDANEYELIISSESGPAKWIIPRPDAKHICYCHSPMRYIWDQRGLYLSKLPPPLRPVGHMLAGQLRRSDVLSSMRVSAFVANSTFVQKRINQYYRRDAEVIHPPVDTDQYTAGEPEDFYLCAGQVVSYKRIDLAVEACTRLGRRLIVAGGGDTRALREKAGPTVSFLGKVDQDTLRDLMRRCRALLFPGVEDFGLVPVEVMASGRPVIAFGYGGALDTVQPGVSGLLFHEASAEALVAAIERFEGDEDHFTAERCQGWARKFSRSVFDQKFSDLARHVLSI
jgi:glycosyltransferase involved in cell wall biosynthesis